MAHDFHQIEIIKFLTKTPMGSISENRFANVLGKVMNHDLTK
jgi:hypothetical protein